MSSVIIIFGAVPLGIAREIGQLLIGSFPGVSASQELRALAREFKPKLLWCGTTAYPRVLEFDKFREIADEVGAVLCADIAHIAGLVAGGVHPSPIGIADVVTSTTHKTLRGPRGGVIMCKAEHAKAIDRAVFPGLQGGPHNHTTAGIAVAAHEAAQPSFKQYAANIVANAKALAEALLGHGFNLITEAVRQIRGTSTAQVEGAEASLVTSGEGVPTSALLLRA